MQIKRLELRNVMAIDHAEVTLPACGLVLVTGPNGIGKSTLIEAIPAAGWNKTLRGSPWYREGAVSQIDLVSDCVSLTRTRTAGGKNKLEFTSTEFDTPTKAQQALDQALGPLDVWRKTSVFSSSAVEGCNFTGGTDAERKRLLEAILDLDRFDEAFSKCTADMREAQRAYEQLERKHDREQTELEHADQRAKDAAESLKGLVLPKTPPKEEAKKLAQQLRELAPELEELRKQQRQLSNAGLEEFAKLRSMRERMNLLDKSKCPTCTQIIPEAMTVTLQKRVHTMEHKLETIQKAAANELAMVAGMREELEEDLAQIRERHRTVVGSVDAYDRTLAESERLKLLVRDSALAVVKHGANKSAVAKQMRDSQEHAAKLEVVAKVLGTRGVRAHILGHSLKGLSAVANKWLGKMGTEIRVSLEPYTENKTGGVSDSIAVNIDGAGGGHGYKACSAGQRRRVDVAIVLGLATMAAAAHGVKDGTVFFDEVFDVLDEEGVKGVADALNTLSEKRCVVVISHSSVLQRYVDPALHLAFTPTGELFEY